MSQRKIEAALYTKGDFLAAVLDKVDALVVVFDRQGKIVRFNSSCEQITGYSFNEVVGKYFWDLFLIPEETELVKRVFDRVRSGHPNRGENYWVRKDGTRRLIAWSNNFLVNSEGAVEYIVSTGIDITERKQAEELQTRLIASLRESEERFRCLIDQARDGIFAIDSSGWFVEANQRACQDLGYTYAELLTLGLWDLDPTWTRKRFAELFKQQKDLRANDTFEADIKRKDGSTFPVEIRVGLLEWNHQQYILALVRDITKRKRFEQVQTGLIQFLEASDERFRQMAENIRDIVWMRGVNPPQILYISPAYEEIWGRSCLSLYQQPRSFFDAVHPDDRDRVATASRKQIQGESTKIEYKIIRPDGSIRWVQERGFPIMNGAGEVYRVTGIIEDITERKLTQMALQQAKEELEMRVTERTAALLITNEQLRQEISDRKSAELALKQSQQRYTLAVSAGKVGVWDWNLETNEIYVDPILKAMLGYADGEIPNHIDEWGKLVHPDDKVKMMVAVNTHLQGLTSEYQIEHRMLHKDGSIRWFFARGTAIKDASGKLYRIMGTDTDITSRKNAEAALQKSEERFRSLVANIPGAIYRSRCDSCWTMEYISDAIANISGYPASYFIQNQVRTFASIIHPQDTLTVERAVLEAVARKLPFVVEYRIIQSDGNIRWVADRGQAGYGENGEVLWIDGLIFDISDRKIAEAEIRNALAKEKELNSLKTRFITMASHEFRTPLSTILSSADLLEYYLQEKSTLKQLEHIQRIQTACLNMTEMLNDILLIGRAEAGKLEFNPSPIDLEEFCRYLVEEMQLIAGNKHKITFESDSCPMTQFLPPLDEKLLRYILNNLISNAIKYSPEGGNVYLRLYYQDSYAIFQIEDEGIGISPEDQDRLFEPFYRAKNVENIAGTGLGLAIVKRSVDLHGGEIDFKSKIGRGTTFTVTLPLGGNFSTKHDS